MSPSAGGAPLVSLGVPVHNAERYLPETLDSLRSQDYENLEIVISDNGSDDTTPQICLAAAAADKRIHYLRQPENRGGAWNYNHVAEQSHGDYFKFAAADDILLPTFVSACLAALDEGGPAHVLAFPRTRLIDEHGAVLEDLNDENLQIDQGTAHGRLARYLDAKAGHIVYGLMRMDTLRSTRGIRPVVIDDIVLMIEMACRGKFSLVPEHLFLQRKHPQQGSAAGTDMVQWYAPGRKNRFAFPFTVAELDCYRAIVSAPLSTTEKAKCVATLTRSWVLPEWRAPASDVRRALRGW